MPGVLELRNREAGRVVRVRRDAVVPDGFWLRLRAEWGSQGKRPGEEIEVGSESFLGNLAWLAPSCRLHGVSLDWDEGTKALVRKQNAVQIELRDALRPRKRLSDAEVRQVLAETRFDRPLRDFQLRDLGRLLQLVNGANFSVPGAGKTTVTLACYEAKRRSQGIEQLLVVAPLSAFEAWHEEASLSLAPTPSIEPYTGGVIHEGSEIVLVNYQRLLFSYESVATWVAARPTQVVLDEAHRIKRGRAGEWGAACLDLGLLAARRDVLTGTPAPQSPSDLGVLLDFLWAGKGQEVLPPAALQSGPVAEAADQVAVAIRPLFVRTTKKDLDLPKITFNVIPVPLEGLHGEIYTALRNEYAGRFAMGRRERADFARMGQIVMYLLEAATNPALLAAGSSADDPAEFRHPPLEASADSTLTELVGVYGAYETPRKFIELGQVVRRYREDGRKTLVWSNFVRNLQTLERMLESYQPAVVHGGVPSALSQPNAVRTRDAELERFRDDPDCWVLLANPAALGEGISLHTVCHDAIYLERTFNAGQYLQSLDRIHRLGLRPDQRTCVTLLETQNTIDVAVCARVAEKARRLSAMLDDPGMLTMALPDEEDVGSPLDTADPADVAALFAHLRGDDAER